MYNEKVKCEVRESILPSAVDFLTKNRPNSFILHPDEVSEIYNYSFNYLNEYLFKYPNKPTTEYINKTFEFFLRTHRINIHKKPEELKVLLLGGPSPLNDIKLLIDEGVLPQNIYTVESNYNLYKESLNELKKNYASVHVYNGELSEFLRINTNVFDIFYFDACGSFCQGKPNTLNPIIEVLANDRLNSLSVLITNFAEVKSNINDYAGIIASFFMGRYNDYPNDAWSLGIDPLDLSFGGKELKKIVFDNFDMFYSDFITRFIMDLTRNLIPNSKALSHKFIFEKVLDKEKVKNLTTNAYKDEIFEINKELNPDDMLKEFIESCPHYLLSPISYPLYTFFKNIPNLCEDKSFYTKLMNIEINNKNLLQITALASHLDAIFEGHWEFVNKEYLKYIAGIWFDSRGGIFCDVPLPNLLINSHLGVLGKPFHINTRKMKRLTYKAKETKMFLDVFVLDKCNEYFDWFPSLELTDSFMQDIRNQILARSMLDRMSWYDWSSSSHPFHGSALAGLGETPSSGSYEVPDRETII